MPTIAWDGKTLAVNEVTWPGPINGGKEREKLIEKVGDCVLVAGSNSVAFQLFIQWFKSGRSLQDWPKFDSVCEEPVLFLILDGKHLYTVTSMGPGVMPIEDKYYACGAFSSAALVGLHYGLDAKKALQHSQKCNDFVSKIHTFTASAK